MKKNLFPLMVALVLLLHILIAAASLAEGFPTGAWGYRNDAAEPVLQLNGDGTALYESIEYAWEDDGQFIMLTGDGGQALRLRYMVTETGPWLYKPISYTRKEGVAGEGIRGVWNMDGSEQGFFEFSDKDTFLEDGLFDGTYTVNYEAGSFTLTYPRYFDDTVCYFEINGDRMIVEYPMKLVEFQQAE